MIKVLHLLDEPWDSGLTANALHLAQLLNQSGSVQCEILCRRDTYAAQAMGRLGLQGMQWGGPALWAYPGIRRWALSKGFDVLHAHTGSSHTLACFLARGNSSMAVLRTRSDARGLRRQFFYERILRATSGFIFPTKSMRERFLMTYHYPLDRARVIYPVLPLDWMSHFGTQAQKPVLTNGTSFLRVLIVGRLDPVKGHKELIQAAALAGNPGVNLRYEIVGEEKNVKREELAVLTRRLGIEPRVHFLGYLQPEELYRTMASSDIAVIASKGSEEVSRVCLEWMSLGKPIVAARVGMIGEVLEHNVSGLLVHPGSHEELAYAIKRLAMEPQLRRSLADKAFSVFWGELAPSRSVAAHLSFYREAAKPAVKR